MSKAAADVAGAFEDLRADELDLGIRAKVGILDAVVRYEVALTLPGFVMSIRLADEVVDEVGAVPVVHAALPGLWASERTLALAQATFFVIDESHPCFTSRREAFAGEPDLAPYLALFDSSDAAGTELFGAKGGSHLIVDNLGEAPAWRGRRLGELLVAATMLRLGSEFYTVACRPSVFGPDDGPTDDREARQRQLLRSVGFVAWDEEVVVLDMQLPGVLAAYLAIVSSAGSVAGGRSPV